MKFENRDEWLQNRNQYIGGSDAAAVLGLNPYMSNVDLWAIKTGHTAQKDISGESYVQYGILAEEYLRNLFALDFPQYEVIYQPWNSLTNEKYPWAAASLDGILMEKNTDRMGILEIKTTNILQSQQREKWNDRIPDNYYIQILHYLMVTEYDFAILKAQLKSEFNENVYLQTKHYYIDRSEVEEDIQFLINEERKFWEAIREDKKPDLKLPTI